MNIKKYLSEKMEGFRNEMDKRIHCIYVPKNLHYCYRCIKKKDSSTYKNIELIFKGASCDNTEEVITFLEVDIKMTGTVSLLVTIFTSVFTVVSKMNLLCLLLMWMAVVVFIILIALHTKKQRYILTIAKRIRLQKLS